MQCAVEDGGPRSGVIRESKSPSQVRKADHTEDKNDDRDDVHNFDDTYKLSKLSVKLLLLGHFESRKKIHKAILTQKTSLQVVDII